MEINPTKDLYKHKNVETIEINPKDSDEDDVFYAELRRQVLLLIAEDDDEEFVERKVVRKPVATDSWQQRWWLKTTTNSTSTNLKHGCYYNWSGHEAVESMPEWIFNFWRSGNGTGVFIPQVVHSRRTTRTGERTMKEEECTSKYEMLKPDSS